MSKRSNSPFHSFLLLKYSFWVIGEIWHCSRLDVSWTMSQFSVEKHRNRATPVIGGNVAGSFSFDFLTSKLCSEFSHRTNWKSDRTQRKKQRVISNFQRPWGVNRPIALRRCFWLFPGFCFPFHNETITRKIFESQSLGKERKEKKNMEKNHKRKKQIMEMRKRNREPGNFPVDFCCCYPNWVRRNLPSRLSTWTPFRNDFVSRFLVRFFCSNFCLFFCQLGFVSLQCFWSSQLNISVPFLFFRNGILFLLVMSGASDYRFHFLAAFLQDCGAIFFFLSFLFFSAGEEEAAAAKQTTLMLWFSLLEIGRISSQVFRMGILFQLLEFPVEFRVLFRVGFVGFFCFFE